MQVPKERVKVLDRLRGLSIVYMLLVHMLHWTLASEVWWFYSSFPVHDLVGGPIFVFVSGAGLTLSMRRHPETPAWAQHLRSLIIFGLGFIINAGSMDQVTLWGWTIFISLGIFRLIGYYAVKLPPWVRVVLVAAIIGVAQLLLITLVGNIFTGAELSLYPANPSATTIIGYILYSMPFQYPLFPYFAFFLAGTLFVDLVIGRPKEKQRPWRHIFLVIGIVLVTVGIILGIVFTTSIDLGDSIFQWLSQSGRIVTEIPSLGSRNSLPWSMLMLGSAFLLALLFLKLEHRMYQNRFLTVYGEFSLTIFAANAPIFLVPPYSIPLWIVLPLIILTVLIVWYLCTLWYKKYKGKYSIEWFLNYSVKFFSRHIENHINSRNGKSEVQPTSSVVILEDNNNLPPITEKPIPDASKNP